MGPRRHLLRSPRSSRPRKSIRPTAPRSDSTTRSSLKGLLCRLLLFLKGLLLFGCCGYYSGSSPACQARNFNGSVLPRILSQSGEWVRFVGAACGRPLLFNLCRFIAGGHRPPLHKNREWDTPILISLFRLVLPNAICAKISKASSYSWHIHNKILIIAIVKTKNAPTLHTTITFSACLFPLTSIYILPKNEAQKMAINNIESFSISPSPASNLSS